MFENMNFTAGMAEALAAENITELTEIQTECIPLIREGKDVVGLSKTGSGKTFAYGIPMVEKIDDSPLTQALVVCPTRELACQVTDEIRKLTSRREGCRVVPVFGGSSLERQIIALKKNARIVVGTPGRLLDHLSRKTLKLKGLKLLVLDEADEMLDMGFKPDIERILSAANPDRQTVMFSATMPTEIRALIKTFMTEPVEINVSSAEAGQAFIDQFYVSTPFAGKNQAAFELLTKLRPARAIVFCNTKDMATRLCGFFTGNGVSAVPLHGDMRQRERRDSMAAIKNDECNVLVATDVAARGIDIKDVDAVINYDLPASREYYIHRIGRTARAGKAGAAYTLINSPKQLGLLNRMMKDTGNTAAEFFVPSSIDLRAPKDKKREFDGAPDSSRPRGQKREGGFSKAGGKPAGKPWGDKPAGKAANKPWENKPAGKTAKSWGKSGKAGGGKAHAAAGQKDYRRLPKKGK